MIVLHGTKPMLGLMQASPFAAKVEVLLKMAELPYRVARADMRKAPRGKMPWIEDAGVIISDSRLIRHHLEVAQGADFSGGYDAAQLGVGLAVERLLENHLYWFVVDNRWSRNDNFPTVRQAFFGDVPAPLRGLISGLIRRKVRRDVAAEGLNKLSQDEKSLLVDQALGAVSAILGDHDYLLGDRISGADATVYAFLASLDCDAFTSDYPALLRAYPNLTAYLLRMKSRYFA